MNAEFVSELEAVARRSLRARAVGMLGPLAVAAGVAWALVQPYRITLLHPYHQGFWWLFSEPPLYVIGVGLLFHRFVARGLVADLEEAEG